MKQVIDNFSSHPGNYATFRPKSPQAIFDLLYANTQCFDAAWDCGTGNGQVAAELAKKFGRVYGTDISGTQLAHATQADNISYMQERAEATTLADKTIDLITLAQAIHWFDFDAFYKEVNRVARPGAVIAAWTYNLVRLTPEVNKVVDHLYHDITSPWWDPERRYIDEAYTTIPFPFRELHPPPIHIKQQWDAEQLIGYLGTWSGVKNYIKDTGNDPVSFVANDLRNAFGNAQTLAVTFPINIRIGIVD